MGVALTAAAAFTAVSTGIRVTIAGAPFVGLASESSSSRPTRW
jgi:hypothetical protein